MTTHEGAADEKQNELTPGAEHEWGPSGVGKVLSVFLAVLLALVVPLSLIAWDIYRVVFNPPLVKRVLTEIVTESDLIPVALEWFAERRAEVRAATTTAIPWIDEPDTIALLAILGVDDWRAERSEVLPNEILAAWVSATVDGTYAWVDSEAVKPQIVWEMQAFKERVRSEHGHNAIQIVYDALDHCEQEEIDDFLARLDAAPLGKEVPYNLCQFPEPWTTDQFEDYHESLLEVVAQVPPQFHLTGELEAVEDTGGVGALALKMLLRRVRFWGRYLWVVAVVLVLIAAIWALWRWRPFGLRWAVALLVGGVLLLLVALLYDRAIIALLARGPLSEAPALVLAEAREAVRRLGAAIFGPTLIQGIVIAVVGLVAIVLLAWRRRRERADDADATAKEARDTAAA